MNDFGLQLRVALVGGVDQELAKGAARDEAARQAAIFEYAGDFERIWRHDVESSGLARAGAMAKTVRTRRYKNRGGNPAALVYSSYPLLQRAFEQAGTVTAKDGKWLALPNPKVWGAGRVKRPKGGASIVALGVARFGKLKFVPIRGRNGLALLVADLRQGRGKRGGYRKLTEAAQRRGDYESIAVFFLVKSTRKSKRLHGAELRRRAERDAPAKVAALYEKHMIRLEQGQGQLGGPANAGRFFINDSGFVQQAPAMPDWGADTGFARG